MLARPSRCSVEIHAGFDGIAFFGLCTSGIEAFLGVESGLQPVKRSI